MKLDRLLAFTRQPDLLITDESQDLETLLQEYPYFSAAQLLLTIKYKQQNSSRLNRQLQKAAAHLPDKNVLAAALNEGLAQMQQLEELELSESTSAVEVEAALETVHVTEPEVIAAEVLEKENEIVPAVLEEETLAEEIAPLESLAGNTLPEVATETSPENSPEPEVVQELEEQLAEEEEIAPTATIEATVADLAESSEEIPEEQEAVAAVSGEVARDEVEFFPETEPSAENTEAAALPLAELTKVAIEKPLKQEEQFLTQAHDRLSWFRFFAGKPLREQPDDVLEELYLEHMSGDFLQAASASLPEIKTELKAVVNHDAEVASNKNLEEEIRRLAYESISDEELPASETLAAIYESQKDYKKALRIYQKLMLKFPDRMTYFAGLIATTKEKLNN